ncbi:hypothetical protein BOSEA31B_20141 [Hyphomicrobiales bacterium]|jgi:hypothetical protein|nr:hypothetical protein BOSEA31B_20141 [Hyphomicrobiales bacterium]CAH1702487.1 hypothetical protein BOSEA1005_30359 [Hyphomicrobiales bacterium]CAI0346688.1 hypothetical protein BO1005MUT1_520200 [Hyphomicrobiales bacterium]
MFDIERAGATTERFEVAEGVSFEVKRNTDGSYVQPNGTVEETRAFVAWWTKLIGCDYEEHRA